MNSCNSKLPSNIDGETDDSDIAELFAQKFSRLYNSVPYDTNEMDALKAKLYKGIQSGCMMAKCKDHCSSIAVSDVTGVINLLKSGKRDDHKDLYTDNVIHGPHLLYVYISLLFTSMLCHGYAAEGMLKGTMVPLPKVKGTNKADNFRAITLSSIFGKVLDLIILVRYNKHLQTSNLQFGFKKGSSTGICTYAVQEVISHYINSDSDVHCILLDASKAFDRLEFCALFKKLTVRQICPTVLRLLLFMYLYQTLVVKWNVNYSDSFNVSNGCKQGGILSPILYCVYTDDLLLNLQASGVGCHIGPYFYGALAYADDIILLNPTVIGTKKMLKICEQYALDHKVLFNGQKSQYLYFSKNKNQSFISFKLFDEKIPCVTSAKHLGHTLCNNVTDGFFSGESIIDRFNKSVNILMAKFGNVSFDILRKLFIQYCSSFYGVTLCRITSEFMKSLSTSWRKAVRRICKIPYKSHSRLLPHLLNSDPLNISVEKRIARFFNSLIRSDTENIRYLARRCMEQTVSNMGTNFHHIFNDVNYIRSGTVTNINMIMKEIHVKWYEKCNNNDIHVANLCTELMNVTDGVYYSILTYQESVDIINLLCTD